MNKETLSRAKELEADIKCIEALLAEHKKNQWLEERKEAYKKELEEL